MKLKVRYSIIHATTLCNLVPYALCNEAPSKCVHYRTGCAAWNKVDPFKRKLLELKYKRI
jgi:hypothetical protein